MSGEYREYGPDDPGEALLGRLRALVAGEGALRLLSTRLPVGLFLADAAGGYEYVNERWCELSGLEAERALGEGWRGAVHPDDRERVTAFALAEALGDRDAVCEFRFLRPDGSVRCVESRASALHDDAGEPSGFVGCCIDVTARRAAYDAAIGASERFRLAFERAPVGTALVGPDGELVQVNPAFCHLVGYSEEELVLLNLADLAVLGGEGSAEPVHPARGELRYRRANGTTLWVAASTGLVPGPDGEPLYYVVQAEDIGERKQTERELRQLADHDALTGLLNRRGFMDGLHRELRRMDRRGEYGALLVLDLDNFKLVNDTAGHMAGDQVLRTTAEVLRRRLRATDVVGRLGGDEFAALVLNVTPRQAREIAAETTEALRALTVTAGEQTIPVDASIGIVAIDELRDESGDDLLAAADRAMYRAKGTHREG